MTETIKNINDVKLLISRYELLQYKIIEVIELFYDYDINIEEIHIEEYSDNDLNVSVTTNNYCRGEHWNEYYDIVFPIAWLFLDDEELKKVIKEKKETEEEARRKQEELNEIFRKQVKEQKEREEYERLKTKYENL